MCHGGTLVGKYPTQEHSEILYRRERDWKSPRGMTLVRQPFETLAKLTNHGIHHVWIFAQGVEKKLPRELNCCEPKKNPEFAEYSWCDGPLDPSSAKDHKRRGCQDLDSICTQFRPWQTSTRVTSQGLACLSGKQSYERVHSIRC